MIFIVQQLRFDASALGVPFSVPISPTGAGNTLIVAMSSNTYIGTISITDNAGNVYVQAPADFNFQTSHTDIWFVPSLKANATSLTFTLGSNPQVYIVEITPGVLDDSTNDGMTFNSESASEVAAAVNGTGNDFYLTVIGSGQDLIFPTTIDSASSPWSLFENTPNPRGGAAAIAYILNDTGSQQATFAVSNPGVHNYATSSISFTDTSGPSPPPPPPPPPRPPCAPVDSGNNLTSGVLIDDLSLFIGPATALYKSPVLPSVIKSYETTNEGRNAIVLDFNSGDGLYARDLGTVFSWPLNVAGKAKTILYTWQPAIIPMPEGSYGRATDWMDGGTNGAKFIQGVMIEADSFNNPKLFVLQDSDTLMLHALNETPAAFNKQSEKAFSCTPFVAHSARIISSDGVEWRVWSSKLVFQPWPELCENWQTEMTSLGLTGWGHVREMNLPYVSTAPLTLVLTFDAWPTIILTLPSTGGVQNKTKLTLPSNKFKLMGLQAFSAQGFRLFEKDLELKIKAWGTTEAYTIVRPFGGPSRAGAVV